MKPAASFCKNHQGPGRCACRSWQLDNPCVPFPAGSREHSTSVILIGLRFSLITAFAVLTAFSQDPRLRFETLAIEHEPWYATVYSIIEDWKGIMWFATNDGLYRYDGYTFTVFKHDALDSTSIVSNDVWSLLEDADGTLWVGSIDGGLNRYDRTTGKFSYFPLKDSANLEVGRPSVWALYQDSRGFIWIGTGGGLFRLDKRKGRTQLFKHDPDSPHSISSNVIRAILEDRTGTIWIATWFGGVNKFDEATGTFKHYKNVHGDPHSLSQDNVVSISEDSDGDLWFGTYLNGLNRFDVANETLHRFPKVNSGNKGLNDNTAAAILEVSPGVVWIGTYGGGLNVFEKAKGTFIYNMHDAANSKSIAGNFLNTIYRSRSGIIWIGTGDGVSRFTASNTQFASLDFFHRDPRYALHGEVTSIAEDPSGILWTGTSGSGLFRYNPLQKSVRQFRNDPLNPNSLSSNFVTCVYVDSEGSIWIGTIGKGLNRLNPRSGEFELFVHSDTQRGSISHNGVNMMCEDRQGRLWLATGAGVDRFEPATKRFVHVIKDLSDVVCLYLGRDESLWLGTQWSGLFQYDLNTGRLIHYDSTEDSTSLARKHVTSMYEDKGGTLWVGTDGGGLDKFDREKKIFSHHTTKHGLPGDQVSSILSDDDGRLWVGTNNGLARFDPRTGEFSNFDEDDGLPDIRFSKASLRRRNGEILLGSPRGVTVFHPGSIVTNTHLPPIVLSSLSTAGRPIQVSGDISEVKDVSIHYDDKIVSFEFAALDYKNPSKNQYAYMLEGFDEDWTYAGTRRLVTYTNLDPGKYTLRVKASNSDGMWNETGTSLRLTVAPPFWMTWWFKLSVVALLLGIGTYLYNWRVNKLLEVERTRDRIARDLHDDVASTLSSIALYVASLRHKLRKPTGPTRELLQKISQLSSDAVDTMGDVVWSVAPQHDSFNDMMTHMCDFASQIFTAHGIKYDLRISSAPEDFRIPLDVRKNIYLIFKEAVSNIVKHSGATDAEVEAELQNGLFRMRVQDYGSGFRYSQTGSPVGTQTESRRGHGLRNMHKRAAEIRAAFKIHSEPGQGTSVTLTKRMT